MNYAQIFHHVLTTAFSATTLWIFVMALAGSYLAANVFLLVRGGQIGRSTSLLGLVLAVIAAIAAAWALMDQQEGRLLPLNVVMWFGTVFPGMLAVGLAVLMVPWLSLQKKHGCGSSLAAWPSHAPSCCSSRRYRTTSGMT